MNLDELDNLNENDLLDILDSGVIADNKNESIEAKKDEIKEDILKDNSNDMANLEDVSKNSDNEVEKIDISSYDNNQLLDILQKLLKHKKITINITIE